MRKNLSNDLIFLQQWESCTVLNRRMHTRIEFLLLLVFSGFFDEYNSDALTNIFCNMLCDSEIVLALWRGHL